MLEKEYEGSVCEVKTLKNDFITTGKIHRIDGGEVEIVDPDGPLPVVPYRTSVKIAVYNSGLGFRMMAGRVYASGRERLRVVEVLEFLDFEQRRFFRVDFDGSAILIEEDPVEAGEDSRQKPRMHPVRVKNLSLCGVMFETEQVYNMHDRLWLRIPLYHNTEEDLTITIHRIIDTEDGKFQYGAEILGMNNRVEQNLCAYLFEQQRQQILRKRGGRG